MTRRFDRAPGDLRPVTITPGYLAHAEGSVLIEVGHTKVICAASIEDRVPPFLRGTGKGWVTAEYGMLPRATNTRTLREASQGKVGGRTMEIQRLIGRSMRSVVRLERLGERTLWLDCDVIQADGGTRTASITGAFVAMVLAFGKLKASSALSTIPVNDYVAATSVGIVAGMPLLDLAYEEDSKAEVDMNIVKTGDGRFIEIQGTAESEPFGQTALTGLLELAAIGIDQLIAAQRVIWRADPGPLMPTLRLATTNPHKVREVRELLAGVGAAVETLAGHQPIAAPDETADTFEGNARIKARYYAAWFPGELVVAEDSGLVIDAMDGAPGVHSARFLGPAATYDERFAEILRRLDGVPEEQRTARFVCALAVADGDTIRFETRGVVEGRIAHVPAGTGGFGYDPLFFHPLLQQTLAQAGSAKAAVSHRARAMAALARWLRDLK